jgi:hypothetical protein
MPRADRPQHSHTYMLTVGASWRRACGPSRFVTTCRTLGCLHRTLEGQQGPSLHWWQQEVVQSQRCRSLQAHGGRQRLCRSHGRGQPWLGRQPHSLCRGDHTRKGTFGVQWPKCVHVGDISHRAVRLRKKATVVCRCCVALQSLYNSRMPRTPTLCLPPSPAATAAGPLPARDCAAELGAMLVKATLRRPKGWSPSRTNVLGMEVGAYVSMLVDSVAPPHESFVARLAHALEPAVARAPS